MSVGHIKLGAPGDLRDYLLLDNPDNYARDGANPFVAAVSTSGAYNELEGWAEFEASSWESGIANLSPQEGALFGTVDTRVSNQVVLAPSVGQSDRRQTNSSTTDCRSPLGDVLVEIPLERNSAAPYKIAWKITPNTSYTLYTGRLFVVAFLARMSAGASVQVRLLTGATYAGATVVDSPAPIVTPVEVPAARWQPTMFHGVSNLSAGTYWIELEVLAGVVLLAAGAAYTGAETYVTETGPVVTAEPLHPVFTTNWYALAKEVLGYPYSGVITRFNGTLYGAFYNTLCKYNTTTKMWTTVATLPQACASLAAFGNVLYIGQQGGAIQLCSTSDVVTAAAYTGELVVRHQHLLWRSDGNNISYTGDGTTWTVVGTVTPATTPVTGMCGNGENMYVSTADGLYYVAPGDFIVPVAPWTGWTEGDAATPANGSQMVSHQGALYVVADNTVYRVDSAHQIMALWSPQDDLIVTTVMNRPVALQATRTQLIVGFAEKRSPQSLLPEELRSALWMFTSRGWHHVADIPLFQLSHLYYDTPTAALYATTGAQIVHELRVHDGATNPYFDPTNTYHYDGWLEYGKIFGDKKRLLNDWESVYIDAENLSGVDQRIEVYWTDANQSGWQLLGMATANESELRWSWYGTRPNSRWLRLGVRLVTRSKNKTPRVRALVVRYHPMVNDQFQFMVAIPVHDNQEMADGTINTQTQAQMVAHLEALIKRVPPFIYEDHLLHQQWEVKIVNHRLSSMDWEQSPGIVKKALVYNLTLRQVNSTPYTP